jgi:DNA-binding IclR family transcriptional regulator
MNDSHMLHVEPTGHRILAYMRTQPEGLAQPQELAEQLDLGEGAVRAALAKLERLGLVDRAHALGGAEEYLLTPAAFPDRS